MKDTDPGGTAADLELIRDYPVTLERLWHAITDPMQVVQWFGPEGVYIGACQMDFAATGPWSCTLVGKETGRHMRLSGVVTSTRAPLDGRGQFGFTWGWHDEDGQRGAESHVMFTVEATGTGARLTLTHRGLDSIAAARDHSRGWLSTLRKFDYFICSPGILAR